MKATTVPLALPIAAPAASERRRNPRSKLPCFILVRPFESGPDYFESIILTKNSSRQGLAFETDNSIYCERMRLLLTFPYLTQPGAINRDYVGEITRVAPLPEGQYHVAVRFLTTAKLTVPHPSALHATEIWSMLMRSVRGANLGARRKIA